MSTRSALELKEEGNECFKAGIHITSSNDPRRKQHLANACLKYASALEAIISFECEPVSAEDDGLMDLKANLFFNLAMANYQLNDFNEGRRCCNAAIAFINNPSLLVNDLGDSHDINDDQSLLEPIVGASYVKTYSCTAATVYISRSSLVMILLQLSQSLVLAVPLIITTTTTTTTTLPSPRLPQLLRHLHCLSHSSQIYL